MRNIKVSCPFCFPFYLYKYWGSVPYLAQGHLQLIQVWHNKMAKEVSRRRSSLVSVAWQ